MTADAVVLVRCGMHRVGGPFYPHPTDGQTPMVEAAMAARTTTLLPLPDINQGRSPMSRHSRRRVRRGPKAV